MLTEHEILLQDAGFPINRYSQEEMIKQQAEAFWWSIKREIEAMERWEQEHDRRNPENLKPLPEIRAVRFQPRHKI